MSTDLNPTSVTSAKCYASQTYVHDFLESLQGSPRTRSWLSESFQKGGNSLIHRFRSKLFLQNIEGFRSRSPYNGFVINERRSDDSNDRIFLILSLRVSRTLPVRRVRAPQNKNDLETYISSASNRQAPVLVLASCDVECSLRTTTISANIFSPDFLHNSMVVLEAVYKGLGESRPRSYGNVPLVGQTLHWRQD